MIRRPPRSTLDRSSAASDVYKRQEKSPFSIQTPISLNHSQDELPAKSPISDLVNPTNPILKPNFVTPTHSHKDDTLSVTSFSPISIETTSYPSHISESACL